MSYDLTVYGTEPADLVKAWKRAFADLSVQVRFPPDFDPREHEGPLRFAISVEDANFPGADGIEEVGTVLCVVGFLLWDLEDDERDELEEVIPDEATQAVKITFDEERDDEPLFGILAASTLITAMDGVLYDPQEDEVLDELEDAVETLCDVLEVLDLEAGDLKEFKGW